MSFQQSATPLLVERPAGARFDSLSSAQQATSRTNAETSRTAGQQWTEETGASFAASSEATVAAGGATAATPIDQRLRTNIQIIRNNLLSIQENLGNLNKRLVSRRIVEGLHDRLRETYEVVLATERLFKVWKNEQQQQQTLDPLERQRTRFLYEKLSSHFQEEIKNVQEVSERVREAAERVAGESSNNSSRRNKAAEGTVSTTAAAESRTAGGKGACGRTAADVSSVSSSARGEAAAARLSSSSSSQAWSASSSSASQRRDNTTLDQQSSCSSSKGSNNSSKPGGGAVLDLENIAMVGSGDDDPDFFLNDDEQELCSEMEEVAEHESLLQANQIFRDLAQLVLQQDSGVDAIDAQMHTARSHIKGAATELYKAHQMQRRSRLRRCALLLLVFVVVSFLLYFYSPFSAVQHVPPTPADKEAVLLQQKQQRAAAAAEGSELTAGLSASIGSTSSLSGAAATALASAPLQTSFGTRFVPSADASASQALHAALPAGADASDGSQVAYSSSQPVTLGRFFQGRMPSSS